jgi:hypothetical protein
MLQVLLMNDAEGYILEICKGFESVLINLPIVSCETGI